MTLSSEELLNIEYLKVRVEGDKLLHDTMKQLATISSAAIVIVVPFVETKAQWKPLIAVAFVGFLICTIAAGVCMRTISLKMGLAFGEGAEKHQRVENWAYPIAESAFLLAIGTLVVFVIRNMLGSGSWSVF